MISIRKLIEELVDVVTNRIVEKSLVSYSETIFESLRQAWQTERKQFKEDDVRTLKKIRYQLCALKKFLQEQEEFSGIDTVEDAEEVITRLDSILKYLDGLAVAGRVRKEIRELNERKVTMPSESERKKSLELSIAINQLKRNAPLCRKCGNRMVLRKGEDTYFWGCSTFPQCWNTRQLKQSELDSLADWL